MERNYEEKLNNLELAMLDEIDMICECSFDEEVKLNNEMALKIARALINNNDDIWELLNDRIIEYIEEVL